MRRSTLLIVLLFQVANYALTDYALADILGDLAILGVRWATVLAIAFCAIDLGVIALLLTPERGQSTEAWYLVGAWTLAAAMNATLTWWGISIALAGSAGNIVPVIVAVMTWVTRNLMVGAVWLDAASSRLARNARWSA